YPAEIERVLRQIPQISDCAVIGVSDAKWGEVGSAFIVSEPKVTEDEIKSFLQTQLAKFKIPKYFQFLNALPKTDSGKIDRKSLKLL
ncbi:MAG: AMP-dependent synthetase, partial [Saprospiraceae bacterium]